MRYPAFVWKEGVQTLAEFPDCPGCQTFVDRGRDIEVEAKEALEGWLESSLIDGEVPPAPSERAPRASGKHVRWIEVSPNLALKLQLRMARHELGLTQAQLARRAGLSQQMIAKLERPKYQPGLGTLTKVTSALGVRVQVTLEKIEKPGRAA